MNAVSQHVFCAVHVQEHHLLLGVEMPSEGTWHKNLTSHPKKPTLKISSLNLLFLLAVLVFYSFFGKGRFWVRMCGKERFGLFSGPLSAVLERGLQFVGRSERQIKALISEFRGPC